MLDFRKTRDPIGAIQQQSSPAEYENMLPELQQGSIFSTSQWQIYYDLMSLLPHAKSSHKARCKSYIQQRQLSNQGSEFWIRRFIKILHHSRWYV